MAPKRELKSIASLRGVRASLRRCREDAVALAERIADLAEPPMKEYESSAALEAFLAANGFRTSRPWANIPTAFRATAGAGRPRIALLAEYDALPECGPRPGQWGHGCGHNLLGVGSALAGIAVARALQAAGKGGQTVVFGTPAEEALSGKVLMAEQGAFRGLDAALAWHPAAETRACLEGGSAMDSISFGFRGKTAHAAAAPHEARSALDAAILMDVAVNFLREHVEENTRIHSVIPDGGNAPNVVPDRAEIWYYVRGRDRKQVDALTRRVIRCARAAAMATETTVRVAFNESVAERIPNRALAHLLDAALRRCRAPRFTPAEVRAAAKVTRGRKYGTEVSPVGTAPGRGSSDEDNVSWFAPLGRISVACVPGGTVGHNREYAAMCRLPGAHRGMLKAAEALALATVELATNPALLRKAKADFREARRGKTYKLPKAARRKP